MKNMAYRIHHKNPDKEEVQEFIQTLEIESENEDGEQKIETN